MLEHGTAPEATGENAGASPEDDFYVPKQSAEPLTGKGSAPSVKRFSRKMLIGVALGAGAVIALAFTVGLQPPPTKPPEPVATTAKPPVPNSDVNALPGGYDQVVQLGEPRPGDLTANTGSASILPGSPTNAATRQLTPIE